MVDMCREKKTGMVEECRQSDGKRALRTCTECGILLGASGVIYIVIYTYCVLICRPFCLVS